MGQRGAGIRILKLSSTTGTYSKPIMPSFNIKKFHCLEEIQS